MSIKNLQDQIKIQSQNGNWNYDPYMHGMANGLICAYATIMGVEPRYLDAPKKWLKNYNPKSSPVTSKSNKNKVRPANKKEK